LTTLLELAEAFDVALSVKFVPFSDIEKQSKDLSPEVLCVSRFSDEYIPVAAPTHASHIVRTVADFAPRLTIKDVTNQGISMKSGVLSNPGIAQLNGAT
jgi:hypothetical protein